MNEIKDIYNIFQFSLNPASFMRNLAVALICGISISFFYHWTSKSQNRSRTFMDSLIPLTMIMAVVIIVIGNSLARAFGLVGAMSIIRFRTAVKDIRDIVFIFFSLSIGIAAGISSPMIAFIGTFGIGLVIFGIFRFNISSDSQREYLLQFSYIPDEQDEPPYNSVLKKYCSKNNILNMKHVDFDQSLELSFYVKLKDIDKKDSFISEFSKTPGVKNINLFFDE